MKYPKMKKRSKNTVAVPSLSGGINLRDALNMCADNQLTDCLNMWFCDGVLKTRAGRKRIAEYLFPDIAFGSTLNWSYREDKHSIHENVTRIIDGSVYKLISFLTVFKDYNEITADGASYSYENYSRLILLWLDEKGNSIYNMSVGATDKIGDSLYFTDKITNYFIASTKDGIYLFVNGDATKKIYKYDGALREIDDGEIYVPIVMNHCKPNGDTLMSMQEIIDNGGELFEGYNLLSDKYRMVYSTVNKKLLENEDSTHPMAYTLCRNTKGFTGRFVEARLTTNTGTYTHKVEITANAGWDMETAENGDTPDNLYMWVFGTMLTFCDKEGNIVWVSEDDYIEDNLEITAPIKKTDENLSKVFSMSTACWFGGLPEEKNSGTRLFLGGGIEEEKKSLVVWSGINKPLYFPESCEVYVGNSNSAVTGFGKQDDMLVIFKEDEIYCTKYDGISKNTATNQTALPLAEINSIIGCLSGKSIRLCRNRLVWLGNDKKVYTLTSGSQYGGYNVFCISEMVDRKLKTETNLKDAYALDFCGHYMLVSGNSAYLMDYNSYGYQYAYSYKKTEDANIKIPWYIWDGLADEESKLFNVGEMLCGITFGFVGGQAPINSASKIVLYSFTDNKDDGKAIKSAVKTKFFDFGLPNHRKDVEAVGVTFGNNGGEPITVRFITESGTDSANITLTGADTDPREAGYIKSRILYPAIRSAVRFGLSFECEGNMAIEGLNITYRTLGGAR